MIVRYNGKLIEYKISGLPCVSGKEILSGEAEITTIISDDSIFHLLRELINGCVKSAPGIFDTASKKYTGDINRLMNMFIILNKSTD